MAKTDFKSVDEYIATLEGEARTAIETVRALLHDAVPEAEEAISYQIPATRTRDGWIFYFSAYKKHFSLSFPPPSTLYDDFGEELACYKCSKSAIQIPYGEPVPADLITRMAKHRARELRRSEA